MYKPVQVKLAGTAGVWVQEMSASRCVEESNVIRVFVFWWLVDVWRM